MNSKADLIFILPYIKKDFSSYLRSYISFTNGAEESTVYGVVWQTEILSGPPYITLFKALTVMKYSPSEERKLQIICWI